MSASILRSTAAWTALLAAVVFALPAVAETYRYSSAGTACQPANGSLAAKFNYNLQYLTNTGTTAQTVVCDLPMDDPAVSTDSLVYLTVSVLLPTPGSTVTCLAQTGSFGEGVNAIQHSAALTTTAGTSNESVLLYWDGALLTRSDAGVVLSLNCKLPPGAKLGTIGRVY